MLSLIYGMISTCVSCGTRNRSAEVAEQSKEVVLHEAS